MSAAPMRDRDLVRLHWPRELRPAFDALFAIDDAMASVVLSASQPALAAIKLAWWRERLAELDNGRTPAEPRLQTAAAELLPRGVTGAELAELEQGWAALLDPQPHSAAATERGIILFALLARLLGAEPPPPEYGQLFASVDLGRRGRPSAREEASRLAATVRGGRARKAIRPVTGLSVLASRDVERGEPFEAEATPGRSWALLKHRFTGR